MKQISLQCLTNPCVFDMNCVTPITSHLGSLSVHDHIYFLFGCDYFLFLGDSFVGIFQKLCDTGCFKSVVT